MDVDLEELAALVRLLKETDFSEFRYEKGEVRIVVRRGDVTDTYPSEPDPRRAAPQLQPTPAGRSTAGPAQIAVPTNDKPEGERVKSPLLGTFYGSPKPGEPAFVKVGDRVEPDTVICIVEVMKLMNSVVAGVNGVVAGIHARDGDLVEHGQDLFTVSAVAC